MPVLHVGSAFEAGEPQREESMRTGMPGRIVVLCTAALCLALSAHAQGLRDGAAVLEAMHERYANNWYDTLTFKQESVTRNPDGTNSSEIWYESLQLPGKLRIDIGQPHSPNGRLIADGKITRYENNQITASRPFIHMLLVLGFDVYRQPVATTIAQIKAQSFDLGKLHDDTWEGQAVYVVGAGAGDLKSKQFWIEKKRLLFVRLIQPDDRDPAKINDTRFTDYQQLPVGLVAARVEFFVNGKNVFSEIYSDIQANPKLDSVLFDPNQFKPQQGKPQP